MIYTVFVPLGDEVPGKQNGPDVPDISGGERISALSAMTVKALQAVVSGSVEGATHAPPSEALITIPIKKPRKPRTPRTSAATSEGKSTVHSSCYLFFF